MGHWRKQMISILVSARCDLNCGYCYVPKIGKVKPEHKVIDVEFAVLGMKDYFKTNLSNTIRFFSSGEPTTAFDVMNEIHKNAQKLKSDKLKVELQTNGTFPDEVAEWIEKNVDVLWISCDGPPYIQDKQRPLLEGNGSTSRLVLQNIERFVKCSHMQFGVRATIQDDFTKQVELVEYFHSLGIKYVCAAPAYSSTANPSVAAPFLLDFAQHFVPAFFRAKELGMFFQTHLMVNFDEEVNIYCRACIPSPHLTTDGYVSCCDWALFGPEYLPGPLQQLVYGKFDKPNHRIIYDKERILLIQQRDIQKLGQNACKGCKALLNCAGGCIGKTIVRSGNLYLPSKEWCTAVNYLYKKLPINKGLFPCFHS